ncbi:unnamed protein product [Peniophora sp. CBMAI 1063]|nr:unnamed protein product [Peniophora sp. CBMAI 1063]
MERVQFQQEQMLPELKDLVRKGLFTKEETKQILRQRTTYEIALVRRIPNKNDFLRYASYEMSLETLRRKRAARLNVRGAPSISDYALQRRQLHIFERAVSKFKSDLGLWLDYLRTAQRLGARALFGRIVARATQLYPRAPALYVLAAQHELRHLAPGAARALLQRGIRMCGDRVEMWREYVRMEIGFVEAMRRRWGVLGIAPGEGEKMDVDEEEQPNEAAQRAILAGAIVEEVIASAAKALPKLELFAELARAIRAYPCPAALRESLLDKLYAELALTLPDAPGAVRMHATRALDAFIDPVASTESNEVRTPFSELNGMDSGDVKGKGKEKEVPNLQSEAFVDALRAANEELASKAKGNAGVARAYAAFVEEWCGREIEDNLKLYLVASLGALARIKKNHPPPPASLLAAHLRLSTSLLDTANPPLPAGKLRSAARKYAVARPHSPDVQLARLNAEKAAGASDDDLKEAWKDARRGVGAGVKMGSAGEEESEEGEWEEMRRKVWIWGLEEIGEDSTILETLLRESLTDPLLRPTHDALLIRYALLAHRQSQSTTKTTLDRLARLFLPTSSTWASIFEVLADQDTADADTLYTTLSAAHAQWKAASGGTDAAIRWAAWLLEHGKGAEALVVVRAAGKEAERRWAGMLAEREERTEDDVGEEERVVELEEIEVA